MGDKGAKELAKYLKENDSVRVLELKGNNITPGGIKLIFDALQSSQTVKSMFCEWNNIGIEPDGI